MPHALKNIMALIGVIVAALCVGACGKISATDPADTVVASLPQAAMSNYAENCSACHGANGVNGAARQLADANYLASVGREALINITTNGVPGGFALVLDRLACAVGPKTSRRLCGRHAGGVGQEWCCVEHSMVGQVGACGQCFKWSSGVRKHVPIMSWHAGLNRGIRQR